MDLFPLGVYHLAHLCHFDREVLQLLGERFPPAQGGLQLLLPE
jgi:hypothetical protein